MYENDKSICNIEASKKKVVQTVEVNGYRNVEPGKNGIGPKNGRRYYLPIGKRALSGLVVISLLMTGLVILPSETSAFPPKLHEGTVKEAFDLMYEYEGEESFTDDQMYVLGLLKDTYFYHMYLDYSLPSYPEPLPPIIGGRWLPGYYANLLLETSNVDKYTDLWFCMNHILGENGVLCGPHWDFDVDIIPGIWSEDASENDMTAFMHFVGAKYPPQYPEDIRDGYSCKKGRIYQVEKQDIPTHGDEYTDRMLCNFLGDGDGPSVDDPKMWVSLKYEESTALYRYATVPEGSDMTTYEYLYKRFREDGFWVDDVVFPPVSSMARYWYGNWMASEKPLYLAPVLHAVADATVPQHSSLYLGNWHRAFEEDLEHFFLTGWLRDWKHLPFRECFADMRDNPNAPTIPVWCRADTIYDPDYIRSREAAFNEAYEWISDPDYLFGTPIAELIIEIAGRSAVYMNEYLLNAEGTYANDMEEYYRELQKMYEDGVLKELQSMATGKTIAIFYKAMVEYLGDSDHDGIADPYDNCPHIKNFDQIDTDGDGRGDACEPDFDKDGIMDDFDNCILTPNPDQIDKDYDGIGDACEEFVLLGYPDVGANGNYVYYVTVKHNDIYLRASRDGGETFMEALEYDALLDANVRRTEWDISDDPDTQSAHPRVVPCYFGVQGSPGGSDILDWNRACLTWREHRGEEYAGYTSSTLLQGDAYDIIFAVVRFQPFGATSSPPLLTVSKTIIVSSDGGGAAPDPFGHHYYLFDDDDGAVDLAYVNGIVHVTWSSLNRIAYTYSTDRGLTFEPIQDLFDNSRSGIMYRAGEITPEVDNTNDVKIDGDEASYGSRIFITYSYQKMRGVIQHIAMRELREYNNVVSRGQIHLVDVEEPEQPTWNESDPEPVLPDIDIGNPGQPPDPGTEIPVIPPSDPMYDPSISVETVCLSSPPDCFQDSGGANPEIQVSISWNQEPAEGEIQVKIRRYLFPFVESDLVANNNGITVGSSEVLGNGLSSAVATTEHLVNGVFAGVNSGDILLRSALHGVSAEFGGITKVSNTNPNRNPEIDRSGEAINTVWHWQKPYMSSSAVLDTSHVMMECSLPRIDGRRSLNEGNSFDPVKVIFKIRGSCSQWIPTDTGNDGGLGTVIIVISGEELIPVIDGLDPYIPDLPTPPLMDGIPDYPFDPLMTLAFESPVDDPELAGLDLHATDLISYE